MWNYLLAALLSPVSIVLYDGNPGFPDLGGGCGTSLKQAGVSIFGVGAAYIHSAMRRTSTRAQVVSSRFCGSSA